MVVTVREPLLREIDGRDEERVLGRLVREVDEPEERTDEPRDEEERDGVARERDDWRDVLRDTEGRDELREVTEEPRDELPRELRWPHRSSAPKESTVNVRSRVVSAFLMAWAPVVEPGVGPG